MDYNGVKFYSKTDLSGGHYLRHAEHVLDEFNDSLEYTDINQIVEFYNICRYFAKVGDNNIIDVYSSIDVGYMEDFRKLYESLKVYKRITPEAFKWLLENKHARIRAILTCKQIVQSYDSEVGAYLMVDCASAEIIMQQFIELRTAYDQEYFFPKSLGVEEKIKIISQYVKSNQANPNYLKLIYESQGVAGLAIPDKIKLAARREYLKKTDEMFKNGDSYSYGSQG